MLVDKKARGDRLRFVILESPGSPVFLDGPDPAQLQGAFAAIS
jgi:3-dehydroquinate synthetase